MFVTSRILLCAIFYSFDKDIKQINVPQNKKRHVLRNIQCLNFNLHIQLYLFFYFKTVYLLLLLFILFFLLYNTVLVLPYIDMNPPRVYMSFQSWTPLPPPSPYHPSGSSQCTSPEHSVSCIEPGLAIHFT